MNCTINVHAMPIHDLIPMQDTCCSPTEPLVPHSKSQTVVQDQPEMEDSQYPPLLKGIL